MRKLRWYIGISLLLHLLFIMGMVDVDFSPEDKPVYDIYEVDIVAQAPSSVRAPASKAAASKKYIDSKTDTPKSISEINKEKALPDITPEISPSKIEPKTASREEQDPFPETKNETPSQAQSRTPVAAAGQGRAGSPDQSAYQLALWKSQVMYLVQRVWKAPPEIALVDKTLKTTYLLRISRSGELLDKRLLISSGNSPYDRSVHLALSSLRQLPQPPLFMVAGQDSVEVTMSFTPPKGAD
ncbi:MAG TPA: TonB C-terminal domain-containing protein [Deltaproteobacteria bacterium]|jgi:colicin import membrane protein|nr:TonB C-terminal domain-containing protein [Deltaproteobacteria bacterium]HQI01846.1 TonB C-terminal domain-containing protein [Deltaproteobacteria bacterium]HQJ09019.1 TonB C-terminal domain-containing protein [Deltaproteobacteria bacterium]